MEEKTILLLISPGKIENRLNLGDSIYTALINLNIPIQSLCSGRGMCGRCKIQILNGSNFLNYPTQAEQELLEPEEIEQGYRLACQTKIDNVPGTVSLNILERSIIDKQNLQLEGVAREIKIKPLLKKFFIKIAPPTLKDTRSDEERLLKALQDISGIRSEDILINYNLIFELSKILRQSNWEVTIVLWKNEIIGIERDDTTNHIYGVACDLGSTKVAGYLIDLKTGAIISQVAKMNKQVSCGEDIISRMSYVINGDERSLNRLQNLAVSTINKIIKVCCEKSDISYKEIYEIVIVGNTCMQQLLLGINPVYLSNAPYPPTLTRNLNLPSRVIGLNSNENANLHIAPTIGGFVGGDCIAAVLASGMLLSSKISICIDIGTNTEIVLGNKKGANAVSCASGPAFEGMHIKFGMRAASGAISSVKINSNDADDIEINTINNKKPIGLCGSAIIDIPAELLKAKVVNKFGAFNKEMESELKRLRMGKRGLEYVITWKKDTDLTTDIIFSQSDIREIQKAKAAIHTGAALLMDLMGCKKEDVDRVYLAGAFGCYINPKNACIIGMYPEISQEKIKFIGNAAGTGARFMLLSEDQRNFSKIIQKKVKYYELATHPKFQEEFVNSTLFPHKDLNLFPQSAIILNMKF
jgi:uncharacterized 2Fe-2S/4Fe-4S cluster protein (DUF4445 family)